MNSSPLPFSFITLHAYRLKAMKVDTIGNTPVTALPSFSDGLCGGYGVRREGGEGVFDWRARSLRCLPSFSSGLLFGRRFDQRGDLAAGQRVEGGLSATGGPALGGQIQYKIDLWDPKSNGRGRIQQVPP